jgi:N-acetylglutamate synthase-like GNAT family acetyltransferase
VRIRLAKVEERQRLEDLQRRASLALPDYREQLLAHSDAIALPIEQLTLGQVFIAERDGSTLGFAALVMSETAAELDGLFVEPDHWGEGVGRTLADHAVHQARRKGLTLSVIASPTALGFYEKCGFSVEGEADTRFGPAVRMSR